MQHLVQTGESQSVTLLEAEVIFIGRKPNSCYLCVSIQHITQIHAIVFFQIKWVFLVYNYLCFPNESHTLITYFSCSAVVCVLV